MIDYSNYFFSTRYLINTLPEDIERLVQEPLTEDQMDSIQAGVQRFIEEHGYQRAIRMEVDAVYQRGEAPGPDSMTVRLVQQMLRVNGVQCAVDLEIIRLGHALKGQVLPTPVGAHYVMGALLAMRELPAAGIPFTNIEATLIRAAAGTLMEQLHDTPDAHEPMSVDNRFNPATDTTAADRICQVIRQAKECARGGMYTAAEKTQLRIKTIQALNAVPVQL